MTIKSAVFNLDHHVLWSNPLGVSKDIEGNELLNQVDQSLFSHRLGQVETLFSSRVKHEYWKLMGKVRDGDLDWSTHHIADDVVKLQKAMKIVLKDEVEKLGEKSSQLKKNVRMLSNPCNPELYWERNHLYDHLGTFYEAFIPYDDPQFNAKQQKAKRFAQTLCTVLKEQKLHANHGQGYFVRGSRDDGNSRSRFQASYEAESRTITITPKNVQQSRQERERALRESKEASLRRVKAPFAFSRETAHALLLEIENLVFRNREGYLFSHKVKKTFWELSGKPQGDPDWGNNNLSFDRPEFLQALQRCFWEEVDLLPDTSFKENLKKLFPEDVFMLDFFFFLLVPHDAENRNQQEHFADSYLNAISNQLERSQVRFDALPREKSLEFEGLNWRDAYSEGYQNAFFEAELKKGQSCYSIETKIKFVIGKLEISEGNQDPIEKIVDLLNLERLSDQDLIETQKKISELLKKLDLRGEEPPCIKCSKEPREWAAQECGHLAYCQACIEGLSSCFCGKEMHHKVKLIQ